MGFMTKAEKEEEEMFSNPQKIEEIMQKKMEKNE